MAYRGFNCSISGQNCQQYNAPHFNNTFFTSSSCVAYQPFNSNSLGTCGWVGSPCSTQTIGSTLVSNCDNGCPALCVNGACVGGLGDSCTSNCLGWLNCGTDGKCGGVGAEVNPAVAELVHEACMSGAASPDSSNTLRCTDNSSSSSGPAGGGGGVVSDGNGATGTTGSGDAAGATPPSVAVNGTIPNGTIGANGTVETILPPGQSHPASSAGVPATSASNISTSENSAPNNPAVASALASRHHTATIAAIVCGVIAVLAILLALFLWDRRRRHARKDLLKVHSFYSEFFPIQNPPMSAVSKVTDGLTPLTPSNELSAAHNLAGEPDLDISASPISNPTDVSLALAQANAQANTRSLSHTFANEKSGAFPPSTSFSSTPLSHSPGPSESLASSLTDGQLLSENAALRAQIETLRAMVRPNDSTATSSDAQSPVESHISLAQSLSSPLTANPQLRTEMAALLNEIERLRLALPPTELAPPPYISAAN